MIGNLLQRLDLHGDVEPIDDMLRRTWQAAGQPLHSLRAVGQRVNQRILAFMCNVTLGKTLDAKARERITARGFYRNAF